MNKEIEKNRLDLAYHKQLVYLSSVLILVTIGVLSFIGTFIWNKDYLLYGTAIIVTIFTISYVLYRRIDRNLKGISDEIKKLS